MRPWTPDTILAAGGRRINVKRACNGCGTLLGDVTDEEMNDAVRGFPLLDVTPECGLCQGLHVLFVKPEPVSEGREAIKGNWSISVLCPGLRDGATVLPCASWEQCGCKAPNEDELTDEFQRFLDVPCPNSPTSEHRYLAGGGFIGAPTADCFYQVSDGTQEAADEVVTGPGLYPVHVGMFDDTTPEFEVVGDLTAYWKARAAV